MSVFNGTHSEFAKELGVSERQLFRQLKAGTFGVRRIRTGLYEIDDEKEHET